MPLSIPLIALLTLSAVPQAPDVGPKAAAIAPFVGEDVAAVVQIDLNRWQAPTSARKLLGKLADEADLAGVVAIIDGRIDALKKAGATDVFLLLDPSDIPGFPVVVVPLGGGADARAITEIFAGNGPDVPIRWPASATIRGAFVAGSVAALARLREAAPAPRADLAQAIGAGGDAAIRVALIPSNTQRRAIEESFPTLPPSVGGGPIATVTRGMTWASIAMAVEPHPTLRLVVQAKDPGSAKVLRTIAQEALGLLAGATRSDPAMVELADAVARMTPEAVGDKVTLEADLEKTAALVSVPVRQFREAAHRSECVNNLKQIGLAMHNYHATYNTFPAAFVASKDGKPLLSWRVLILPYLEQKELFDQFHLNEAWDSPHNKPLIARMPTTYACTSGSRVLTAQGKTTYLTPRGPGTMFPGAVGVKLQDVTDGTSNTIMVLEASDDRAVTWTRPDDWEVTPESQAKGLSGHHPRGTNFGFGDGSVKFIKEAIAARTFQALLSRNGGEVISAEDY